MKIPDDETKKYYLDIFKGLLEFEEDRDISNALEYAIHFIEKTLPIQRYREYVLYSGEEVVGQGTAYELSELIGVKPGTIRYYASPVNLKRIEKVRKNIKRQGAIKHYVAVKVEDDE